MIMSLTEMKTGTTGTIIEIRGGRGMAAKLENRGLRPGKTITKVSSLFFCGPQVVDIDHTQLAVGFGMARRIFVEVAR